MGACSTATDCAAGERCSNGMCVNGSSAADALTMHMLDISQEKASAATNYISFYGFLNIVAVGLLFYISRSN